MTHAEIWARYHAHARFLDRLWAQIHQLDATGVDMLDPERQALVSRALTGSDHLCRLFDMLPETKAENARLGPAPEISEHEMLEWLAAATRKRVRS